MEVAKQVECEDFRINEQELDKLVETAINYKVVE